MADPMDDELHRSAVLIHEHLAAAGPFRTTVAKLLAEMGADTTSPGVRGDVQSALWALGITTAPELTAALVRPKTKIRVRFRIGNPDAGPVVERDVTRIERAREVPNGVSGDGLADNGFIRLRRPLTGAERWRGYTVLIDGTAYGSIRENEIRTFELAPGLHTVRVRLDRLWGSQNLRVYVDAQAPVDLVCSRADVPALSAAFMFGKAIKLLRADHE